MLAIFVKTLPFFALIGVGYVAGRTRFFSVEATAYLTRFVFYFALSAMLFRFAANLSVGEIFDPAFAMAYLSGCTIVYLLAFGVALARRVSIPEASVEAQCAVIGNTGFLGVPMLTMLLGPGAAGPVLMVLAIDLIVFSSLITLIITVAFWRAVFAGQATVGGLTAAQTLNYVMLARIFHDGAYVTSMLREFGELMREGGIEAALLRPLGCQTLGLGCATRKD